MANLLSLQKEFLETYQKDGALYDFIKVNGPSAQNRFSVYQDSLTGSLRDILTIIYPLTWKLIGEECANQAALAFIRKEQSLPTDSGTFGKWGETFPDFLEQYDSTQCLPYLPDFAKFEWLKHLAYIAEDQAPLNAHDFKEIDPENYGKLILKLHPSAQLFSSAYPLDEILAVVKGDVESINLSKRKVNALIIQPFEFLKIHWLSDDYFSFFFFIQKGDSLIGALEKIDEKNFHFHEVLSFSLNHGLFSHFSFTS